MHCNVRTRLVNHIDEYVITLFETQNGAGACSIHKSVSAYHGLLTPRAWGSNLVQKLTL
jgi:hypothetical protein